jgi:hypothetical protein
MTHIIGSQYDVARWENLRVWAERGLIRVEDARDNSYQVITVEDAKDRIVALTDIMRSDYYDANGRTELRSFIGQVLEIMQKAQEQGMPSDPQASRDLKDRRAKSFLVPADIMGTK